MKAVILEVQGKYVAALLHDGCILKLKNEKYAIGQVIEVKKTNRVSTRVVVWAASVAAAVVVLVTGAWAYFTPYTYVSLDVNPSIEYEVNRFDRVLSAEAVNNDGQAIMQNLELRNKSIDQTLKETIIEIAKNGYFEDVEPGGIMISTSNGNEKEAQLLAEKLKITAQKEIKSTASSVEVEAVSVGLARVQEARSLGTTPGKLNLVEILQASSETPDSVNVQDWLKKPVKDIMKAIKHNKKGSVLTSSGEASVQDNIPSVPSASSDKASTGMKQSLQSQEKNKNQVKNKSNSSVTDSTDSEDSCVIHDMEARGASDDSSQVITKGSKSENGKNVNDVGKSNGKGKN